MATDPDYLAPRPDPPAQPVPPEAHPPASRPRGILSIVVISALVGAIAGSLATIVAAGRLVKTSSTGNVPPRWRR